MDRLQAHPAIGPIGNHGVEGLEEEPGDSLAGCALYPSDFEQPRFLERQQLIFARVVLTKNDPVVEMPVDPILDKMKLSEINDESVVIKFLGLERQGDGPTVTVQAGATPFVKRLTVGKGDVPIGLATGNHVLVSGFIFRGVRYLCEFECFLSLYAGSAFAAMVLSSRIA
jgi:hypothetical protein